VKKSKFSESQIVGILKEVEAGAKVGDTCRKHGISDACYYQWTSKYAGMEVSQLAKMRELQAENAKLKRCMPNWRWCTMPFRMLSQKSFSPGEVSPLICTGLKWSLPLKEAPLKAVVQNR